MGHILRQNGWPGVLHPEFGIQRLRAVFHPYRAACRSVLSGVFQQIRQRLGGPFQIADAGQLFRAIHLKLHIPFQIQPGQTARRPLNHLPGGQFPLFKGNHPCIQPGKAQQRLHQPADAIRLRFDLGKALHRLAGRQLLPQKVTLQQNGRKGCAQLMGNVAQAVRQKALVRLQRRCLLLQNTGNFVQVILQRTQLSRRLAAEPGRLTPGVHLSQIFRQLCNPPVAPQGIHRGQRRERPAQKQRGDYAGHTPDKALPDGRSPRQGQHNGQHPVKFPAMHPVPPPSGSQGPVLWRCASRSRPPVFPAGASR